MKTGEMAGRALDLVARTPFLNRRELAVVSGWTESDAQDLVSHLVEQELVNAVRHSTPVISSSQRFYVNADGVRALARSRDCSPEHVLHTYPVSREWRDLLMGRLDGLAIIYRLMTGVARVVGPVEVRLYRSHSLDATITLPDGSTIGVLRQGSTASRSSFGKRLDRLFLGPLPGGLLVVASDPVRLRHLGNSGRLRSTSRPVYLILEESAAAAGGASPVWWPSEYGHPLTLEAAMSEPVRQLPAPEEDKPKRVSAPDELRDLPLDSEFPVRHLPTVLTPREKTALDALAAWTWLSTENLCAILGVRSRSGLWRMTRRLRELGLLYHADVRGV